MLRGFGGLGFSGDLVTNVMTMTTLNGPTREQNFPYIVHLHNPSALVPTSHDPLVRVVFYM